MHVHLSQDGQYVIADELLDLAGVEAKCRLFGDQLDADGRRLLSIRIVADRRCRATQVVRLIEAARRTGIWRFSILAMSNQGPLLSRNRSYVQIPVWYRPGLDNVEEILPGPQDSVQDLVRELDGVGSDRDRWYCVGKYKLE